MTPSSLSPEEWKEPSVALWAAGAIFPAGTMPSILHRLKNTPLALRWLAADCRRAVERAKRSGDPSAITSRRCFYAIERRLRDLLMPPGGPARFDEAPPVVRDAFECLCEALAFLRDHSPRLAARDYNWRLSVLEKSAGAVRIRAYPLRCYFELTDRCNLQCAMCGQKFLKGQRSTISREDIAYAAPWFQWMGEVGLFGYGESLMVDHVAEVLDAIPPGCISRLSTNGLLLDEKNGRMLADHGLRYLTVSIDAAKPETYLRIRGVDRLAEVKENVRRLAAYKREKGLDRPEIHLGFVSMLDNIAELPDFVRMAKDLGADAVAPGYLIVFSEDMRQQSLFYNQEAADRYMAEAEAAAQAIGIRFLGPQRFASRQEDAPFPRCIEPWEFIYFRSNGTVSPCCGGSEMFGSWKTGDLQSYWNGEEFQRYRRALRVPGSPDMPGPCRDCLFRAHMGSRCEANHVRILYESQNT